MGCDGRTSPGAILARRAAFVRTAKSCGPGAPMQALRSLVSMSPANDGGNQAWSPGRVRISRKTIAQGRPDDPPVPVVLPRAFCCTRTMGAVGTRPSLRPPVSRAVRFDNSDASVPRDYRLTSPTFVMPRACGAASTPRPLGSITTASGTLNRPGIPDPVGDRRPGDDIGVSGCLKIESKIRDGHRFLHVVPGKRDPGSITTGLRCCEDRLAFEAYREIPRYGSSRSRGRRGATTESRDTPGSPGSLPPGRDRVRCGAGSRR
jgi:hypothetical protein